MERLFFVSVDVNDSPKFFIGASIIGNSGTVWCETTDVLLLGISRLPPFIRKREQGQSADQVSILKNSIHYFGVGNGLGFLIFTLD